MPSHWYAFWERRKIWLFAATLLLWAVLALLVNRLSVSNSTIAFFPDGTNFQILARGMDIVPLSKFVLIDIASENAANATKKDIAEAALQFKAEIPDALLLPTEPIATPPPSALAQFLPAWFTKDVENRILKNASPDRIRAAVQATFGILTSFSAGPVTEWLRIDPLNWRELLFSGKEYLHLYPTEDAEFGIPLSQDGQHALLLLRPSGSMHDTDFAVQFMDAVTCAQKRLPHGMSAHVSGGVRHTSANTKAVNADIAWILTFSLTGLALVYALFVRSWGAVWIFLTPCFAATAAMGTVSVLFPILSGLALGFGSAVLGIAEDYAVHMHFALRSCQDKKVVFNALAIPLLQGFLLNASGFFLLLFSSIPAVRQIAAFAQCTLLTGFLTALLLIPLCPGIDRPGIVDRQRKNTVKKMPVLWKTCLAVVLLGAITTLLFVNLPIDVSPQSLGADMENIQRDTARIQSVWSKDVGDMFIAEATDAAQAVAKIRRFGQSLEELNPGVKLLSIASLAPGEQAQQENIARWNRFQKEHGTNILAAVEAEFARLGLENDFVKPFQLLLSNKAHAVTFETMRASALGATMDNLLQAFPAAGVFQALLIAKRDNNVPLQLPVLEKDIVHFAPETLAAALTDVFRSEALFLPGTLLLCILILFLCFRNIAQTLLISLSPICAVFTVLLVMFFWEKPLTLAGLAAFPLVTGLAVDHGIMVVHDLENGTNLGINRAIVVSSLTTFLGMGLLAFAQHPALQAMGQVIFLGLMTEAVTALWLLPLFCRIADE